MLVTTNFSEKISLPESTLIEQVQLKNEKAFGYLYDAYSSALFGIIKRLVKYQMVAEEVLQNVFLKIWFNIEKYSKEKGSLYTWMVSIARNLSIDYLRSKEVKKRELTCVISEIEPTGLSCTEQQMRRYDILKSLSSLEQKERLIIELSNGGFTCREIAQMCSLPEGSVKTKMRRSYRKMRVILL